MTYIQLGIYQPLQRMYQNEYTIYKRTNTPVSFEVHYAYGILESCFLYQLTAEFRILLQPVA